MPTIRPSAVSTEVVTSKRVRQYEDDDDDDDDDDEDDEYDVVDDDDDEVHEDKNDEEEIEEIVEVQHIDSDSKYYYVLYCLCSSPGLRTLRLSLRPRISIANLFLIMYNFYWWAPRETYTTIEENLYKLVIRKH